MPYQPHPEQAPRLTPEVQRELIRFMAMGELPGPGVPGRGDQPGHVRLLAEEVEAGDEDAQVYADFFAISRAYVREGGDRTPWPRSCGAERLARRRVVAGPSLPEAVEREVPGGRGGAGAGPGGAEDEDGNAVEP